MNAIEWILDVVDRNADREFLRDTIGERRLTFGQLHSAALAIVREFHRRGWRKGDRVVLLLDNSLELAQLYFACLYAGIVTVPVNPAHTLAEVDYIMGQSRPTALLTQDNHLARFGLQAFRDRECTVLILNPDAAVPDGVDSLRLDALQDLPLPSDPIRPFDGVVPEDWMTIVYTSGTAAHPKGVVHTISNLVGNARSFNQMMGIGADHRFYGVLSMTYFGGYFNLLMLPFMGGASVVLAHAFDARASLNFWDQALENDVNTLWLVPTILSVLMEIDRGSGGEDFCRSRVRLALVGTAPLAPKLKSSFERRYGVALRENYALTETLFLTTDVLEATDSNPGMGRPLPDVEIRVSETNEGEIRVRTPHLMQGYFDSETARPVLDLNEGFLETGDVGILDVAGRLFISGRKKDLIIRGGVNLSPAAVESVLNEHPAVAESAAVGIPHALYGEDVAAVVRLINPESDSAVLEELAERCRRALSAMSQPVEIFEMAELPKTATGKVQKSKIRELLIHKMGLSTLPLFATPTPVPEESDGFPSSTGVSIRTSDHEPFPSTPHPGDDTDVDILRHQGLADQVVFVDGLAGCGKTMLSPIVSSYDRVEKLSFAYEIEYVCALAFLKKMTSDAAKLFVQLYVDQLLYELMMSRNANFRPKDLSSVFRDPQPLRYFARLFNDGDRAVPDLIARERPIPHLTTHHMLAFAEPIFEALGKGLTFIELVRHPLYMIKQHVVNMETICGDSRDLNVYVTHRGQSMPYYALEWRDKFVDGSPADRAVYYFEWFFDQCRTQRKTLSQRYPGRLVTVPFEQLVLQPEQWLAQMGNALGVEHGKRTRRELKRQKIPRSMVADGRDLPIYKRFRWEPPRSDSEQDELDRRREFIKAKASPEAFQAMEKISAQYEQEFPYF